MYDAGSKYGEGSNLLYCEGSRRHKPTHVHAAVRCLAEIYDHPSHPLGHTMHEPLGDSNAPIRVGGPWLRCMYHVVT